MLLNFMPSCGDAIKDDPTTPPPPIPALNQAFLWLINVDSEGSLGAGGISGDLGEHRIPTP